MKSKHLTTRVYFRYNDNVDADITVSYWFTPGEDSSDYGWVDPEIEVSRVQTIHSIITATGILLDKHWLESHGYYTSLKRKITTLLHAEVYPESSTWYDLEENSI